MEQQILESTARVADPEVRRIFVGLVVGTPLLGLLPMAWSWGQLSDFLSRVRQLSTDQDLKKFKALARRQMVGALVQIAVLIAPFALFLVGLFVGALDGGDSLFPVGAFAVVLLAGVALRRLEKRVQSLPCQTPDLEKARDAVVQTWLKKALPDWQD